jgi:hypothetical protein
MRLLLDEGFPMPPGFRPEAVDASMEVCSLREFDPTLAGSQTPDWYLYFRAHEAGFDALVTRDWHQSEQAEELWALMRTNLSIVTWKKPVEDPIREWGQLLAYLPEVRRVIGSHGPSIVFLPSPRLTKAPEKADHALGVLASERKVAVAQVRREAQAVVVDELTERDELERFRELVA